MAQILKQYVYKVYEQDEYAGHIPYATTEFTYDQDINTGGAQIRIEIGSTIEQAGITVETDRLIDHQGNLIIDQQGNRILVRKEYRFETIPMNLGNRLDVWLYDDNLPNGRRMFTGIITEWESDEKQAKLYVTAISYGIQLDNYMLEASAGTPAISFIEYDTSDPLFANAGGKTGQTFNRTIGVAQTFTVAALTTIEQAAMVLSKPPELINPGSVRYQILEGAPGTAMKLLAQAYRLIENTLPEISAATLDSQVVLTTGKTYTLAAFTDGNVDTSITAYRSTGTGPESVGYANGQAYSLNDTTGAWTTSTGDYAFRLISAGGNEALQFNSYDPGEIMRGILDNFKASGGSVLYTKASIDNTGTVVSYNFKSQTTLDGIKTVLKLAPSRWYWYVDPGANIIHFHRQGPNLNHVFTRGKHAENLKIRYSMDGIKNHVRFSGGDPGGGVNITARDSDVLSLRQYGQWLSKDSDNRVTTQETANLIAANVVSESSKPRFSVEITLVETRYDIESINIGDIVGFNNFNALVNDLRLQIVSLTRTPTSVTVRLDTLPPSTAHRIEDIKRNLDAEQTKNNPT